MIPALDLCNHVRDLGYTVSALANSGEEAVRLAEELVPDLVLMDIHLHGPMDGIEASRRIQELKHIPIVYLTAYPSIFIQSPASMQRPYLCISKPFSVADLRAVIRVALAN